MGRGVRGPGCALAAIAAAATAVPSVSAQTAGRVEAEAEVIAVVQELFDGMRAADTERVRSVFHPEARLGGLGREGSPRFDGVEGFVGAVGGSEGKWDERIWDPEVRVDDYLATAWTPYAFYFDGRLSHCGVNAFQFLRTGGEWKIVHLVDSRRREGCEPPPGAR